MKKVLFSVVMFASLSACDYSVNSNGNIDEAFSHEPITHSEQTHLPDPHHSPAAEEAMKAPVVSDTTATGDTTHPATTTITEEANH